MVVRPATRSRAGSALLGGLDGKRSMRFGSVHHLPPGASRLVAPWHRAPALKSNRYRRMNACRVVQCPKTREQEGSALGAEGYGQGSAPDTRTLKPPPPLHNSPLSHQDRRETFGVGSTAHAASARDRPTGFPSDRSLSSGRMPRPPRLAAAPPPDRPVSERARAASPRRPPSCCRTSQPAPSIVLRRPAARPPGTAERRDRLLFVPGTFASIARHVIRCIHGPSSLYRSACPSRLRARLGSTGRRPAFDSGSFRLALAENFVFVHFRPVANPHQREPFGFAVLARGASRPAIALRSDARPARFRRLARAACRGDGGLRSAGRPASCEPRARALRPRGTRLRRFRRRTHPPDTSPLRARALSLCVRHHRIARAGIADRPPPPNRRRPWHCYTPTVPRIPSEPERARRKRRRPGRGHGGSTAP